MSGDSLAKQSQALADEQASVLPIVVLSLQPYLGADKDLALDADQRKTAILTNTAIDTLRRLKRRHPLKLMNSFDGIRLLRNDRWERPADTGRATSFMAPCSDRCYRFRRVDGRSDSIIHCRGYPQPLDLACCGWALYSTFVGLSLIPYTPG